MASGGWRTIGGGIAGTPVLRTQSSAGTHSFGRSYQTEAQQNASGGGGGGGGIDRGQAGGMMTDPYQQLDIWKEIADFQQRQNTATRDPILGLYNAVSGQYSGRIAQDPYNAGSVGLMEGSLRDMLQGQTNAQRRQLQDTMARRGGAVGYGAENELQARYQKNLGDIMRQVRTEAIDKNRAALEKAMQLETMLASQKAGAYEKFPVAVDLPKFSRPTPPKAAQTESTGGGGPWSTIGSNFGSNFSR